MLISCTAEDVPSGLYDYQVVRLMTHDSTKIWKIEGIEEGRCDATYFYQFSVEDDSITYSHIQWNCVRNQYSDTTLINKGIPSSLGIIFTDSINWANGNSWSIRTLTESELEIQDYADGVIIRLIYFP